MSIFKGWRQLSIFGRWSTAAVCSQSPEWCMRVSRLPIHNGDGGQFLSVRGRLTWLWPRSFCVRLLFEWAIGLELMGPVLPGLANGETQKLALHISEQDSSFPQKESLSDASVTVSLHVHIVRCSESLNIKYWGFCLTASMIFKVSHKLAVVSNLQTKTDEVTYLQIGNRSTRTMRLHSYQGLIGITLWVSARPFSQMQFSETQGLHS